jgi:glycerophosphoryl diester phosphodiesterase
MGPSSTVPASTDTLPPTSAQSTTDRPAPSTTDVPERAAPPTVDDLLALGRPIVLAHAGGEDVHPHSTPYGFAESVAAGVDMLDMDVQLTADGVLVVQHDDTVDRTTNATGRIDAMTYEELFALDNAYWFTLDCVCKDRPAEDYVFRGIRTGDVAPPAGYTADDFVIPRFRDIATRFPDMPLNIEVKGSGETALAAARVLAQELHELGREDSSVVTSFDDAAMAEFIAAGAVEVTPGLGASSAWVLDGTPLPDGMRILQLPVEYQGLEVLTPDVIARSHAAGYVIWVWPNDAAFENPDGYRRLLEMGMDGLNINRPEEGVAVVESFTSG